MEQSTPATVKVEVICDAENKVVGHLHLVPGTRPKVAHANLVWDAYKPLDNKYRLPPKVGRAGEYWHCPLCQGHLSIRCTKDTGEVYPPGHPRAGQRAPAIKDVLSPIVFGRTQVQVS